MPDVRFSIVLCTRNPRPHYISRVIEALKSQAPGTVHEVVVVDSSSSPPLSQRQIAWPENTRIVRVDEPGIGRARIAGVRAAQGDWIVFVDDDNVLDADYLTRAAEVIEARPEVMLFCGLITGEFEQPPPQWLAQFHRNLAIIDFPADVWANYWDPSKVPSWTAGMCVCRDVATAHCDEIATDPFACGIQTRVEDVYLVMRTVARGHWAGLFTSLHLRHLIPKERMTPDYLCKIADETAYNMTVLRCRQAGPRLRDFLRPLKSVVMATLRHGCSPAGRVARTAAFADLRGAAACLPTR